MKYPYKKLILATMGVAICLGLFVTTSNAQRRSGWSVSISYGPRYSRPIRVYRPQPRYYVYSQPTYYGLSPWEYRRLQRERYLNYRMRNSYYRNGGYYNSGYRGTVYRVRSW